MENRIQYLFLVASFSLAGTSFAQAQPSEEETLQVETQVWEEATEIAEPEIKRQKVDVDAIDAYDLELGLFAGQMNVVDFGTNPVLGVTFAYHVTENIFTQLSYGTTDTEPSSFEVISGSNLLTDEQREYSYYDLSVGYNLLHGESFVTDGTVFNSAFYVTAGVGSTDFAGDQRYTYTVGLGYRFLFTDWLAMHVEVKDHIFDIDILGTDKTTHNFNYTLGVTAFF